MRCTECGAPTRVIDTRTPADLQKKGKGGYKKGRFWWLQDVEERYRGTIGVNWRARIRRCRECDSEYISIELHEDMVARNCGDV